MAQIKKHLENDISLQTGQQTHLPTCRNRVTNAVDNVNCSLLTFPSSSNNQKRTWKVVIVQANKTDQTEYTVLPTEIVRETKI